MRWHKYPEEKPKSGTYFVTITEPNGERMTWRTAVTYRTCRGKLWEDQWQGKGFYFMDQEYGDVFLPDVVAWMEFPDPFKED